MNISKLIFGLVIIAFALNNYFGILGIPEILGFSANAIGLIIFGVLIAVFSYLGRAATIYSPGKFKFKILVGIILVLLGLLVGFFPSIFLGIGIDFVFWVLIGTGAFISLMGSFPEKQ